MKDNPTLDKVLPQLGEFYNKDKGARFVLKYAAQFPEGAINAIEFEKMVEIFDQFGNETKRVYDFVIKKKKYELKAWTKWAHWSDEAFLNQFVKDIASIGDLENLQWVFMKTEDITEESLHKYVIKAIDKNRDLKILVNMNSDKLTNTLGIKDINNINKIEKLTKYFSDKDNFEKIFKVVE